MRVVNLYRYEREPGKITTSPVKPDDNIDYSIIYRLIADEDMAITNGSSIVECVDTNSLEDWADCKAPISDYNDLGGNYG